MLNQNTAKIISLLYNHDNLAKPLAEFVGLVADGTTDVSGNEQFSVCLQYATKDLEMVNSFLGMYNAPESTGETLASVVKDVLLWLSILLMKLEGFSFDGAANMSGWFHGVQSILRKECTEALYVHCANHSLDFVLQEVARSVRGVADALQFVRDVSYMIRESS